VSKLRLCASRFPPINDAPVGLAQHLYRARRLLKLRQSEAAALIGVDLKTYKVWEIGGGPPHSHNWPDIIAFLGCDPIIETPATVAELVSAVRRRKGLTAEELGRKLGAYKLTVRAWEAGRREPRPRHREKLQGLLIE
jgi:DNA-binding transcriptional regulator YiaG